MLDDELVQIERRTSVIKRKKDCKETTKECHYHLQKRLQNNN